VAPTSNLEHHFCLQAPASSTLCKERYCTDALDMSFRGEGRALAHEATNQAGKFCSKLGYEMSADVLAQWIADRTKIWTQYGAKRPSGVVAMILGIDEEKETPQLSTCDPAGYFLSHKVFIIQEI